MPLNKVQPRNGLNWQFLTTSHSRSPSPVLFPSILHVSSHVNRNFSTNHNVDTIHL